MRMDGRSRAGERGEVLCECVGERKDNTSGRSFQDGAERSDARAGTLLSCQVNAEQERAR